MLGVWIASGVCLVVVVAAYWAWLRRLRRPRAVREDLEQIRRGFHHARERLEAKFLSIAGKAGKPRGLSWKDCEFDDGVAYARDRRTGDLCAFVAVTISFEAVPGGGMEEVEAVGNLRAATAVFTYRERQWTTDGRAIFNLNPAQTIAHFHETLVLLGHDAANGN